MTNRTKGQLFRSMPLLTLASSGSAFLRERMATASNLLTAPPPVRFKAMMLHFNGQGSTRELCKSLERMIGNQYSRMENMAGADLTNNRGVK
jgi:hypothetical protein